MGFGDLMQWLDSSQKSGALIVEGETFTKKLYFQDGHLLAAASDNPREMLGYYLVGWGYCSEDDLRYMIEIQDHFGIALGNLVVKLGHMTHDELTEVLMVKTKETIYDLLGWTRGNFRFIDDELPGRDFLEVSLPVSSFLFEGFRQRDERARMKEAIPSSLHVPQLVGQTHILTGGDDDIVFGTIDGKLNIEQISLLLRLPEFQVLKFVYRGVTEGVIEVRPPSDDDHHVPGKSDAPGLELARESEECIRKERLFDALKIITTITDKYGDDELAVKYVEKLKADMDRFLDRKKISGAGILEVAINVDDLVNLDCDPAESFVLSRITGTDSVRKVINHLPGSRLHNRVIIHNLLRRGLVKIEEGPSMADEKTTNPGGELEDPFELE